MTPRVLSFLAFPLLVVSSAFAVSAAPARAQASSDTLALAQRLVGAGPNDLTADALPPNWISPVPLPTGLPILGSLSHNGTFVSIYYRPTDARQAFVAYSAQLVAAGFANLSHPLTPRAVSGLMPSGSFSAETFAYFCRDGQNVYVRTGSSSNDDLRVELVPKSPQPCAQPMATPRPPPVSPLPTLIAPAGTTLVPTSGTTMSVGSSGSMESTSSTASILGNVAAPALLSALISQLKAAGWSVQSQLSGRNSAVASVRYQNAGQRWQGWLSILGGLKPQTFIAHIDAVNTGLPSYHSPVALAMGAAALYSNLSWVPANVAKTDEPRLLQFVRQLVTLNGFRPAQLYLGRIPPAFSIRIPLPQATPVGSTVIEFQPGLQGQVQFNMYYHLSRARLQAYTARLQTLGWKLLPSAIPNLTGFQFAYFPVVQSYCNNTRPPITVSGTRGSDAFVVGVQKLRNGFSCDTMQGLIAGQGFPNPLPTLDAPAGTMMLPGNAGVRAGNSAAMIVTPEAIGPLLDGFTAKFTRAGWVLAASTTMPDLGSRSYTYVDGAANGQKWQAVLTLYRSFADAGTYYAFVDMTKLPQAK
jgi:hypothetical protein